MEIGGCRKQRFKREFCIVQKFPFFIEEAICSAILSARDMTVSEGESPQPWVTNTLVSAIKRFFTSWLLPKESTTKFFAARSHARPA
jgi:hypothetical protein